MFNSYYDLAVTVLYGSKCKVISNSLKFIKESIPDLGCNGRSYLNVKAVYADAHLQPNIMLGAKGIKYLNSIYFILEVNGA